MSKYTIIVKIKSIRELIRFSNVLQDVRGIYIIQKTKRDNYVKIRPGSIMGLFSLEDMCNLTLYTEDENICQKVEKVLNKEGFSTRRVWP